MRFVTLLMMSALLALIGCQAQDQGAALKTQKLDSEDATMPEIKHNEIPFYTIEGVETRLKDLDGKALLIVNVASECGNTPQYEGLEAMYQKYRDRGLLVIGFPANNFGGQEPGSDETILEFCQSRYNVTFPMMSKISVKGDDKHPLFEYLTEHSTEPGEVDWNFAKFLLDADGHLVARYPAGTEPDAEEIITQIERLL